MKDLMGKAAWDYYKEKKSADLFTETSISDVDEFPIEILFRDFGDMNTLEQKALMLAKGNVLDIGCGAGSHSLYLQNVKHLDVTAIDISAKSVEITKERGVKKVFNQNLLDFEHEPFDSIILLMNGSGIFEDLDHIDQYLKKINSLLKENGSLYIDSTDIIYMYDQDEDGGVIIPYNGKYYGELEFTLHYKEEYDTFPWLYIDFNTLANAADANGFIIEKIIDEEDSYLAKLTKI